jgi:hypothetical protein
MGGVFVTQAETIFQCLYLSMENECLSLRESLDKAKRIITVRNNDTPTGSAGTETIPALIKLARPSCTCGFKTALKSKARGRK